MMSNVNHSGHFVLGVIYSKCENFEGELRQFELDELPQIQSVVRDFTFFAQPKYRIAVARPGSGNTKNIGSVVNINSWSTEDEDDLTQWLQNAPCRWALSTWHSNEFRENETAFYWESLGYYCHKIEHFYHVGASEDLRHPMIEAVFTNFDSQIEIDVASASQTLSMFA